jgi:hypothetical protein
VLYAAAFGAAEVLGAPLGFVIAGCIGVVIGLVYLVRFLHTHPVVKEG